MVKLQTRTFKFFNNDMQQFEEIPFIERWEFKNSKLIRQRLEEWRQSEELWRVKRKEFNQRLNDLLASPETMEKQALSIEEIRHLPRGLAEQAIKGEIKELEKELGGPVTPGIFFLYSSKRQGMYIQHNTSPLPDLSLDFFMLTPINTIEFLQCTNYDQDYGGHCYAQDWSGMAHREKTITCMVDEESGEKLCDTIHNLAEKAHKPPFKLLRGTTNEQEIFNFLIGQEQLKEMLTFYEDFMTEEE